MESDRSEPASFGGIGPVQSSRVLVRCLRGLGDAVQFLRFARELRQHCTEIVVQAPARVLPLLRRFPGIDEAVSLQTRLTGFDFEIECSDLPYLFRTTLPTLPPPAAISGIETHQTIHDNRPRVGIAWAAGDWNPIRSIPLSCFRLLTDNPGVQLFSLQRGTHALELRRHAEFASIVETEQEHGSILDTAVTIASLDLVVSVDTMVAHLAGTLGRPVWTLLNYAADWRWMLERSDSPWYPSMRLFRQPRPGDWTTTLLTVRDAIRSELEFDHTRSRSFESLHTPV